MGDRYMENDPIYNDRRQESMNFIRCEIEDVMSNGTDDTCPVDKVLYDIDMQDIDTFLHQLIEEGDFPFKLPILREYIVDDDDQFAKLCDYVDINGDIQFSHGKQMVFFLESADCAITIIPIELDKDCVNMHIELLDRSPKFIKDMWEETLKKKTIDDLKREGKFVKLH